MADNTGGQASPPGLILWALVLGASGVVAGIFGPASFDSQQPEATLATAIITAPIAMIFGLLLGKVVQRSGVDARLQWQVLFGCAAALVLATLYFCMAD